MAGTDKKMDRQLQISSLRKIFFKAKKFFKFQDYEVIDVYWRRDIEQEKTGTPISLNPFYNSNNAVNSANNNASNEQFERDLQLLTEKSYSVVCFN